MENHPNDPPALTPDQEESVRRLLADARVTDPMPEDVRGRLDGLLRGLADERVMDQASDAPVIDLAARRRARIRNLLVAAAAVVAIGVAVPPLLQGGGLNSANESSDAGGSADSSADMEGSEPDALEGDPPAAETAPESSTQGLPARPRIRDDSFEADAEAARNQSARVGALADAQYRSDCLPAVDLDNNTTLIAVRFEGQDAVLVLQPEANDAQRASLYVCGESSPRRTALLDPQ